MSSEEIEDSSMNGWVDHFEGFCDSDDLSIDEMCRMTKGISSIDLSNSSFFHLVCMNEKVTLEIVQYLLDLYPSAINIKTELPHDYLASAHHRLSAYPLHLACYNEDCPNEVIQLLITKGSESVLTHMCYMEIDFGDTGIELPDGEYHGGTPLHYYLSRTSNVDLITVKELVVNPEILLSTAEDSKCTPIHILLHNDNIGDMYDVVKYLAETNPSSLQMKDQYDQTPLNVACMNEDITTTTIEYLLVAYPSSIRQQNNVNALPIHSLCEVNTDGKLAIEILKLLLEAYPDSVIHIDCEEKLPLLRCRHQITSCL